MSECTYCAYRTKAKMSLTPSQKKMFWGILCALFITLSSVRSIEFLLGHSSFFSHALASAHFSLKFSPFSSDDGYENTRNKALVYVRTKDGAYRSVGYAPLAQSLGGGHAVKVVVYSTVPQFPRQIAKGREAGALQIIRNLYCTDPTIADVKINIFNRYTGVLSHTYDISC